MPAIYTISSHSSPLFETLLTNLINTNNDTTNTYTPPYTVLSIMLSNLIRIKNITTNQTVSDETCPETSKYSTRDYKLVNYVPEKLTPNLTGTAGIMKSLIFTSDNKLISFCPPKSHSCEMFAEMFTELSLLQVEEFVDGTMVNLFWDPSRDEWDINTRRKLGANNYYYTYTNNYHQPTFRNMFYDTAAACGLDIAQLDRSYVYSFVLCHPENRLVTKVESPRLVLVEVYKLNSIVGVDVASTYYTVEVIDRQFIMNTDILKKSSVSTPRQYLSVSCFADVMRIVNEMSHSSEILKGLIVRDPTTNARTKFVTDSYNKIMFDYKNNCADMRFMYLSMRANNTVSSYLTHFPEHTELFEYYHNLLCDYTHFLYALYIECYVKKTKPLAEYPVHVKTHMFNLHKTYKARREVVMDKKCSIALFDAMTYVNNLDVPLLYNTLFVVPKQPTIAIASEDISLY